MSHTTSTKASEPVRSETQEIAFEEEQLRENSKKDVERQLEQQHMAEIEEKAVEAIEGTEERILSPKGQDIEAKLSPAVDFAGHLIEKIINDVAAGVASLREEFSRPKEPKPKPVKESEEER